METYSRKTPVWNRFNKTQQKECHKYAEEYKKFLDAARTERLANKEIIRQAKAAGYRPLSSFSELHAGDKVYLDHKGKAVIMAVIGRDDMRQGLKLIGSHIDSPRLDLKANPLDEKDGLVFLRTHYYGGIKKYQWVCMPLALVGVIAKTDGSLVNVEMGLDAADPVLYITDILPHLGQTQAQKKLNEAITGEMLLPVIGGHGEGKKSAKEMVLKIFGDKYGITEEDFASAELEGIPAQGARDVGIDRAFVMAHGQDDRVCSYGNLAAILAAKPSTKTQIALFTDKEEIGSYGNTGVNSSYVTDFIMDLLELQGDGSHRALRDTLRHTEILSADVTASFDPTFADVMEKNNSSLTGFGIVLTKYTGARGKSGSNDANAEFLGKVRGIFNENNVPWQIGELGKVDQGGGGTIALYLAAWGCEVVDCGVTMLSMHAPLELVEKTDAYCAYLAYKAFFESH